jgi:hypothetical protein
LLSFSYFFAFYFFYRDPSADTWLSKVEYNYIKDNGGAPEGPAEGGAVSMLGYLLTRSKVRGLTIGFAAYGYTFYLFVGGWLIDHLIKRGMDESRVRKTVRVVGMSFGLAVFGATQTTDPVWAIFWVSIALGGLAAAAPAPSAAS